MVLVVFGLTHVAPQSEFVFGKIGLFDGVLVSFGVGNACTSYWSSSFLANLSQMRSGAEILVRNAV